MSKREAFSNDFIRGTENTAEELTRVLDGQADVTTKTDPEAWDTYTRLAWRPAWSIRSRRGALKTLIDWWRGSD